MIKLCERARKEREKMEQERMLRRAIDSRILISEGFYIPKREREYGGKP